jgi:hypothetical protein
MNKASAMIGERKSESQKQIEGVIRAQNVTEAIFSGKGVQKKGSNSEPQSLIVKENGQK